MNELTYVPIEVSLLYEGMVVPYDIYDHALKNVLIPQGSVIRAALIEKLKEFNKNEPTIYVSAEMEKSMRTQGLSSENVVALEALEKKTGYGEAKSEALDMLEKITNTGAASISQKALNTVSRELSRTVEITEPAVILDLVNALAPVDEYLQRHCINVSLLNGLLGKWLKLPKELIDLLVLVGLLHDCGKALLPNKILSAPRALTGIEFEVIKTHPALSTTLLTEFPEVVRQAARGHHEKMNGKGYPDGLSGAKIPHMSRITAISDIYDAMTARRSYKEPKSPFSILSMLNGLKGTDLDPKLVEVFVSKMPEELMGKPIMLSTGQVGIVHAFDVNDIEHPTVKVGDRIIKTDDKVYCLSMHLEDAAG